MKMNRLLLFVSVLLWPVWVFGAESDVGIILMHGKWARLPSHVTGLARVLEARGIKVAMPEMPWSNNRQYDADYPRALAEIDTAVQSLRDMGAKRVIVAGHSFGANAAIAYAGAGKVVDGVMAIAPGHVPDLRGYQSKVAGSVEKAKQMVAEGKGDSIDSFDDFNQGKNRSVRMTATAYLSYFDPDGIAAMPKSAGAIPRPIPFLWMIGSQDQLLAQGEGYVFNKAPKHPNSKYLVVSGGHLDTPGIGADQIAEWVISLGY